MISFIIPLWRVSQPPASVSPCTDTNRQTYISSLKQTVKDKIDQNNRSNYISCLFVALKSNKTQIVKVRQEVCIIHPNKNNKSIYYIKPNYTFLNSIPITVHKCTLVLLHLCCNIVQQRWVELCHLVSRLSIPWRIRR